MPIRFEINANLVNVSIVVVAVMVAGSLVRWLAVRRHPDTAAQRLASLWTWWGVTIVVIAAALLGRGFVTLLLAIAGLIAYRELVDLHRDQNGDVPPSAAAYVLIPLSYLWIGLGWSSVFAVFLPLSALLVPSLHRVLLGQSYGFTSSAAHACWGLLLTSYLPAHAALLFTLPGELNPVAGCGGWFLFLVLLTEMNDIVQALVGRAIGGRKIAERISPHKTWAGFLGGLGVTVLAAMAAGHWLTPWSPATAATAGLLIAVAGFLGDLNVSALKRDAGVKDASRLLPGQGGMLDRIDSLTFSAPVFYYLVIYVSA